MLSAAHDLLTTANSTSNDDGSFARPCNKLSTGAILLADIIPSVVVKLLLPFFPLWIHFRLFGVIALSVIGFVLVAFNWSFWLMIAGVALTSFASGMGESSLLAYMPAFHYPNVISSWSSGTGGAGVLGSLSYLAFTSAGVDPSTTILTMNVVPILMGIAFWLILVHPGTRPNSATDTPIEATYIGLRGRLSLVFKIVTVYMAPFALVYLFEYFINQGLSEIVIFKGIFPSEASQYRWYSFMYQVGVMISRSSVNIVEINNTWILAALQGVNVAIMTTEAIYLWLNSFWVVLIFILWEGLLGGCSYVNTYRRINVEMPVEHREFSMSMNSFGDSIGTTIAGFLAIPVHNAICNMPPP